MQFLKQMDQMQHLHITCNRRCHKFKLNSRGNNTVEAVELAK